MIDPRLPLLAFLEGLMHGLGARDHAFDPPYVVTPDGVVTMGPCLGCGFRVVESKPVGELVCPVNAVETVPAPPGRMDLRLVQDSPSVDTAAKQAPARFESEKRKGMLN